MHLLCSLQISLTTRRAAIHSTLSPLTVVLLHFHSSPYKNTSFSLNSTITPSHNRSTSLTATRTIASSTTAAASVAAAPSFHRFPDLPTELKLEVLRHRLYHKDLQMDWYERKMTLPDLLPVALTSKGMQELAYTVYYGQNQFELRESGVICSSMLVPRPEIGRYIHHVTLAYSQGLTFSHMPHWNRLLADGDNLDDRSPTQWQSALPNLISLKVRMRNKSNHHAEC
jgi:hypothetical protein